MYALIRAVVRVRRNITRLVLQSSFLKGPYAFCSELESDYERLASPLSLTTCFDSQGAAVVLLRFVDNGVSVLSMANTPGCSLS